MAMVEGGILRDLFNRARNVGWSYSSVTLAVASAQQNNIVCGVKSVDIIFPVEWELPSRLQISVNADERSNSAGSKN